MSSPESTLYIHFSLIGMICIAAGVLLLFLMLFVFQNPHTIPGALTYIVAIFLIAGGGWIIRAELMTTAHAMGYEKPER